MEPLSQRWQLSLSAVALQLYVLTIPNWREGKLAAAPGRLGEWRDDVQRWRLRRLSCQPQARKHATTRGRPRAQDAVRYVQSAQHLIRSEKWDWRLVGGSFRQCDATRRGSQRRASVSGAFPYTSYQRMTLDDVRDLFGFLKSLPAEVTPSMPHELAFPFNIRRGLGGWKLLYPWQALRTGHIEEYYAQSRRISR